MTEATGKAKFRQALYKLHVENMRCDLKHQYHWNLITGKTMVKKYCVLRTTRFVSNPASKCLCAGVMHPVLLAKFSPPDNIYFLFKEHKFLRSQFSLVSPYESGRDKTISTAWYSPFNICLSFWICFFLPIHHMGKLRQPCF